MWLRPPRVWPSRPEAGWEIAGGWGGLFSASQSPLERTGQPPLLSPVSEGLPAAALSAPRSSLPDAEVASPQRLAAPAALSKHGGATRGGQGAGPAVTQPAGGRPGFATAAALNRGDPANGAGRRQGASAQRLPRVAPRQGGAGRVGPPRGGAGRSELRASWC